VVKFPRRMETNKLLDCNPDMSQVSITQLPQAQALSGTESVPIVQFGVTVQTTTGAISGAGALNYPFLTVGQTAGLAQSRYISTNSGLSITDNGAQGTLQVNLIGAAMSLNSSGTGIQVKTGSNTLTARSLAVGAGLGITNADGVSGNPTVSLGTMLQQFVSLTGTGILALQSGSPAKIELQGTTSQISIANGNGATDPVISLASNPVVPGNGSITVPNGTSVQRTGSYGAVRYNTSLQQFEGYTNTGWNQFSLTGGVTSFSAGTTGFTPNTDTTGAVTLAGTLNVVNGGTGTTTPALVAGTNVTITGTWPNQTINSSNPGGTVTSVTATSPVVSTGGTTPVISMPAATTSVNGYLTSTDWNTFNNKQPSGAYLTAVISDAPLTGAGTSASHLSMPAATTSVSGYLTSTDWNTFNGKQPAGTYVTSVSGTTGRITSTGGTTPVIDLTSGIATAGTTGSSTLIPVVTIDTYGRVTSITTAANPQGTVTSVGGTGSVNGITLTGTVTSSGNLTLGGTLGSIANSQLTNSSITINGSSVSLGGSVTVTATASAALTIGTGLSGTSYNGSTAVTIANTGVLSFSGGTTGLTPATATTGAVTLAGTLVVGNGGTGVATLSGLAYGNGTSAFTAATAAQVVSVIGSTAVTNATNATNATNVGITAASSGATNYLTFVTATSGNLPELVNSSITCNAANGTITGGIAGGAF